MYQLPASARTFTDELEIKRSRFLTFIRRVQNAEEARTFIAEIKHKFPDARHHCSAFIYHVEGANPVERSSDDGEPAGTAGQPMLDVLRGCGMLDICAVVVRYFGGVKLGTGGLVRAYSDAVSGCLRGVVPVTRELRELYEVSFGHDVAGRLEAELRNRLFDVVDTSYGATVTLTIAVPPGQDTLATTVAALTQGNTQVRKAGQRWVEIAD